MPSIHDPLTQLSPIALKNLIDEKFITIIPSDALWFVLGNENLTDFDKNFWIGLTDKTKFNELYSDSFTIKYLATLFKKSTSTIRKTLRRLESENLVASTIEKNSSGYDIGLILQITLPYQYGQYLRLNSKNRTRRSTTQKAQKILDDLKETVGVSNKVPIKSNSSSTKPISSEAPSPSSSSYSSPPSVPPTRNKRHRNMSIQGSNKLVDKLLDMTKNFQSEKIEKDNKNTSHASDPLNSIRNSRNPRKVTPSKSNQTNNNFISISDDFVLNKLMNAGLDIQNAVSKVPEILFALNTKSFNKLSRHHAVNIACKLIKTNKWQTPYGYIN